MKAVRKLIYTIFGLRGYLRLISRFYICLINMGMMKSKYPELFFLKLLVQKGDTCLDIGANLGYYSYFLCKQVGTEGKVYAVEPIPDFRDVLIKNIPSKFRKNFMLFPYALGNEEKKIEMGMPVIGGIIHHGMTHVLKKQEEHTIVQTFEVEMKIPDRLFAEIQKLDFVKCDVEGYEYFVLFSMQKTLKKYKPIVQCELGGENKKETLELMKTLGFVVYALEKDNLKLLPENEVLQYANDVYFVHNENVDMLRAKGILI